MYTFLRESSSEKHPFEASLLNPFTEPSNPFVEPVVLGQHSDDQSTNLSPDHMVFSHNAHQHSPPAGSAHSPGFKDPLDTSSVDQTQLPSDDTSPPRLSPKPLAEGRHEQLRHDSTKLPPLGPTAEQHAGETIERLRMEKDELILRHSREIAQLNIKIQELTRRLVQATDEGMITTPNTTNETYPRDNRFYVNRPAPPRDNSLDDEDDYPGYPPAYVTPRPGYPRYDTYLPTQPPSSPGPGANYYSPRHGPQFITPSPSTSPKVQGHTRRASPAVPPQYWRALHAVPPQYWRASHAVPPQYSSRAYATPRGVPEYVSSCGPIMYALVLLQHRWTFP